MTMSKLSIESVQELDTLLDSEHYASLTGELKCPCGGYLVPPIHLCNKGHGSCDRCRRVHKRCPICKEIFSETRSMALEALVEKLQFPCPNDGCLVKCPLASLDEHSAECNMRISGCFMAKVYGGCDWRGRAADWLSHCSSRHPEKIDTVPFATFSEPWAPKRRNPIMRYHLLSCYEKVFNVYQIYHSQSGKMMWSIVVTGDDAPSDESFFFELEIFNPDNPVRNITFRQPCKNGNDMDILDASQNVLLPIEQILYMLDKNKNIHFNVRICERKNIKQNDLRHFHKKDISENCT